MKPDGVTSVVFVEDEKSSSLSFLLQVRILSSLMFESDNDREFEVIAYFGAILKGEFACAGGYPLCRTRFICLRHFHE